MTFSFSKNGWALCFQLSGERRYLYLSYNLATSLSGILKITVNSAVKNLFPFSVNFSHSMTKKPFATNAHCQREKSVFYKWRAIGYINHTPGQVPCPGVVGQHSSSILLT